ncbi:MAG: hypothetical protein KDA83_14790, partial [Planctomycetales bacterium]|nr:hypothetical protein [Planctomycetales bacterium]
HCLSLVVSRSFFLESPRMGIIWGNDDDSTDFETWASKVVKRMDGSETSHRLEGTFKWRRRSTFS